MQLLLNSKAVTSLFLRDVADVPAELAWQPLNLEATFDAVRDYSAHFVFGFVPGNFVYWKVTHLQFHLYGLL